MQGYVTALSAILEEAKADPTGAAYQQLQELAKEIARLCQVVFRYLSCLNKLLK